MNSLSAEEIRRFLGLGISERIASLPVKGPEPEPEVDKDDITYRLRHATPCMMCSEVTEEAASLIEKLRGGESREQSSLMLSLESAIVNNDPCGRCDCVAVSSEFLLALRSEIVRLRGVESLAKRVAIAAKRAWRTPARWPEVASAIRAFDSARSA